MASMMPKKDWSTQPRRALTPTEIVTRLSALPLWQLQGDGPAVRIEKTFRFAHYHETMAFVNAVAFIAHAQDHHPELVVGYGQCSVAWNTHDVGGLTETDFDCAARVEALLG